MYVYICICIVVYVLMYIIVQLKGPAGLLLDDEIRESNDGERHVR